MVPFYVNINEGKGDRPIHNSTIIWDLQFSEQGPRRQDAPLMRLREKRLRFGAESQDTKCMQQQL